MVVTASYQASYEGFANRGYSHPQATALMELSVQLAKEAREQAKEMRGILSPLIAASIGPYGAFLADGSEYRGLHSESKNL